MLEVWFNKASAHKYHFYENLQEFVQGNESFCALGRHRPKCVML